MNDKSSTIPLFEKLRLEQRQRWQQGDRVPAETYLEQLGPEQEGPHAALELVYHEVMLREEAGEKPGLEEYQKRFPLLADKLQAIFDVHRVLASAQLFATLSGQARGNATWPAHESKGGLHDLAIPGYEIMEELGVGGMGVVYKARQVHLKRLTALKMILGGTHASAQDLTRFRLEAEAVARLQHPNIVQIYEVGTRDSCPYLALEYVDGGSLEKHLKGQPLPDKQAAELIRALAQAVHYAHQCGIVHRDLKPANILLQIADCRLRIEKQDGGIDLTSEIFNLQTAIPKITDFGLAKRLDDESGQTRTGTVVGMPSYMAPEQAAGRIGEIGPATDVHALGAILYELLTGRPPFQGNTVLDTLEQVRSQEPVLPSYLRPKLPRDLEAICLKCLEKEPRHRYVSAEELADDLARFLKGELIIARSFNLRERLSRLLNRSQYDVEFRTWSKVLLLERLCRP